MKIFKEICLSFNSVMIACLFILIGAICITEKIIFWGVFAFVYAGWSYYLALNELEELGK